jgi:hypothetical protein
VVAAQEALEVGHHPLIDRDRLLRAPCLTVGGGEVGACGERVGVLAALTALSELQALGE